MTDRELLQRFTRDQSQDAFATLVERYAGLVYGTCFRVLNESHAAEDAAQATFLAFAQKAATFTEDIIVAGWLHRAALMSARDVQKAALRRQVREQEASVMPRRNDDETIDWNTLQPEIDAALAALPTEQRDTIVLRYLHGLSHAQLASEFACPPETIHTRLTRGMKTLREILERRRVYVSLAVLALLLEKNVYAAAPSALVLSIQQACAAQVPVAATAAKGSTLSEFFLGHKTLIVGTASAALIALGIAFFTRASHQADEIMTLRIVAPITPSPVANNPEPKTVTKAERSTEGAVKSSLEWLARIQDADGRYNGAKFGALENQDVAVTSLALLAYLGAGHTTKIGDYRAVVERSVAWLKENPSTGITQSALRLVALAEHSGMTNTDRVFVQKELHALVARQEVGGMWVEPDAKQLYERVIEPTTWAAFALKSAQVSGMEVPDEALLRTRGFLRLQSQTATLTTGPQDILSRASLYNARMFLGDKTGIEELTAELLDHKPAFNPEGLGAEIIGWYQGSIAAFNNTAQWNEWSPVMRRELLANQITDGDFAGAWNLRQSSENFKWGRIGVSAMSTLNLEIYYRYMALTQKTDAPDVPIATTQVNRSGDF